MSEPTVRLISEPEDLAQFATDLAALGPMTARSLAEAYLDQNLAEGQDFNEAVEAFTKVCEYYV